MLFANVNIIPTFAIGKGGIAQSVEQRTENPCVPGSIPGATTEIQTQNVVTKQVATFFYFPW